jgi:hypothetical protein
LFPPRGRFVFGSAARSGLFSWCWAGDKRPYYGEALRGCQLTAGDRHHSSDPSSCRHLLEHKAMGTLPGSPVFLPERAPLIQPLPERDCRMSSALVAGSAGPREGDHTRRMRSTSVRFPSSLLRRSRELLAVLLQLPVCVPYTLHNTTDGPIYERHGRRFRRGRAQHSGHRSRPFERPVLGPPPGGSAGS